MLAVLRRFVVALNVVGCVLGALGGVVQAQEAPPANAQAQPPAASGPKPYPQGITCIWMPSLSSQSYSVIDDQHLVIDAALQTYYLLTLSRHCFDLDTTLDVGLDQHGDQLCSGDAIVIDRDRCSIAYIEKVADEKDAKAIVTGREAAEKAQREHPGN